MADDQHGVPEGFERFDPGGGYGPAFGPVYLHRDARKLGFRVAAHHLNPLDTLHGGAMATFADMQIAVVRPDVRAKGHTPTITLTVDYLAPAKLGDWVEAEVSLMKTTSTMAFTQALLCVNGTLVARSNAIYRRYAAE